MTYANHAPVLETPKGMDKPVLLYHSEASNKKRWELQWNNKKGTQVGESVYFPNNATAIAAIREAFAAFSPSNKVDTPAAVEKEKPAVKTKEKAKVSDKSVEKADKPAAKKEKKAKSYERAKKTTVHEAAKKSFEKVVPMGAFPEQVLDVCNRTVELLSTVSIKHSAVERFMHDEGVSGIMIVINDVEMPTKRYPLWKVMNGFKEIGKSFNCSVFVDHRSSTDTVVVQKRVIIASRKIPAAEINF